MNAKAKFVIFCILATIILWLVPSLTFLPGSVTAYFNQMGTGVAVHFMLILLILVPVGGQPVTNYAKIFSYVPWKLMPFLGAIIIYSGYMGSDTYGIKALLINLLGPVVSNMSLIALLIIALFICIVVTNFVSNTVAATIVTSVFVPLVASFSGATTNLLMLLAIAVSCIADSACCTLAGSVTAGVAFDDNVVPYSEGIKPCIAYSAVLTAVTCVLLLGMGLFL